MCVQSHGVKMPGVLVRCACTNNAKFAFQHDKPDVSVKEFTKVLLAQYESYRKRVGHKGPKPDVIHLVDGCGYAVLDDVEMSVYLSAGEATFGLVLRDDMEKLALQHDATVKDVLENLCFDKDRSCFSFSYGIFKRPDTKKRGSPELSDAPTEARKDKRSKGPVKEMMRDMVTKGLCADSDIPEHGRQRLFKLPHDAGLKVLEAFKELMSKNKDAEKKQLFMQSLEPFAPPSSPAKGASTPTKPLALTDGAEETATGKKRKQDDQASKKEAPAAADAAKASNKKSKTADAADKLQIAASGKTLAASATSSPDKKAAAKKDEEAKKKKEEERLAKEKDKEEKERVKKEKAAKEKEEKERLKKEKEEKAAKEKEEKERLKKEKAEKAAKEKEEKERQKKEKEEKEKKEKEEKERKKREEEAAKAKAKEEKKAAAAAKAKELAAAAKAAADAAAAAEKAALAAGDSDAEEEEEGEKDADKKGAAKAGAADAESEQGSGGETEDESSSDEDEEDEKAKAAPVKKAAAAAEKRAADAAKKDDDKRKSLQAEKEKLEAQLRNKKSPAATPASKGSNAGEPGKVPAFAGDKWHADVKAQLTSLEKKGKLKEAELDQGALKALKTLPYEVALVCLTKVMNETNAIRNINAFIVKNCTHLRNQWGIDDAASSSSDDDSSDDESESEEEEEASKAKASTPAAAKAAPKVVDVKPVDDSDSEDDEDATEASGGKSEDAGDSDSDASDGEQVDALKALVASGTKGKPSPVATRVRSRARS